MHLFRIASAALSTGLPKDWFYTVYTHYSHSLLKADPVTQIFPAVGPPSLDVPPTCHPSVWSLTKEKQRDRGKHSSANRERDVSKYDSHLWEGSKEKRKGTKWRKKAVKKSNKPISKLFFLMEIKYITHIILLFLKKNKICMINKTKCPKTTVIKTNVCVLGESRCAWRTRNPFLVALVCSTLVYLKHDLLLNAKDFCNHFPSSKKSCSNKESTEDTKLQRLWELYGKFVGLCCTLLQFAALVVMAMYFLVLCGWFCLIYLPADGY